MAEMGPCRLVSASWRGELVDGACAEVLRIVDGCVFLISCLSIGLGVPIATVWSSPSSSVSV